MYAVISLCHFCEVHGPSVLMSTQPCPCASSQQNQPQLQFYGPPESLRPHVLPSAASCQACLSMGKHVLISTDHNSRTSFVSSPLPWQSDTEMLVRQACTRSLSCEVSSGRDGCVFYGEDGGVSVFSMPFVLKDSMARGFQRWYSFIVLSRDKLLLLNTMPFLQKNAAVLISHLQDAATKVQEKEGQIVSPRALRLSNATSTDKSSRPLTVLTGLPTVFQQIHSWSVWMFRNAATRLRESLSPILSSDLFHQVSDSENGFTVKTPLMTDNDDTVVSGFETTNGINGGDKGPVVSSLRQLRDFLGPEPFDCVLFCLLIGHQVVVRGQPSSMVTSTLQVLQTVLPSKLIRCVLNSPGYLSPSSCNMLGLESHVAVPQPSPVVARIEILPEGTVFSTRPVSAAQSQQFTYHLKWGGIPPTKWPTLLIKIGRVVANLNIGESTLQLQVDALKEESLSNALLLRQLGYPNDDSQKFEGLLHALDIGPQDRNVLAFWTKS